MKQYLLIFPMIWAFVACSPDPKNTDEGKTTDSVTSVAAKHDTAVPIAEKAVESSEKAILNIPEKKETTPPKQEQGGGKRAASLFDRFRTSQVLVVNAADEKAIQGTLRLYEWDAAKKIWQLKSDKIAVTLGRTGLAWAKGLQPQDWHSGESKKEGDGKAPQGIFEISSLFGYAEKSKLSFSPKMPYTQNISSLVCVDDINSAHYNQILESKNVKADWKSKEDMLRKDNLYELGAVVAYNTQNVVKGDGSCVFLHIWRAADKATAGCTAMTAANAKAIFSQLDASKKPLLIQMTSENYEKYKDVLQFP